MRSACRFKRPNRFYLLLLSIVLTAVVPVLATAAPGFSCEAALRSVVQGPNNTVYFSDARIGQTKTYRLLGEMLQKNSDTQAVYLPSGSSESKKQRMFLIDKMKEGDTLIVNLYTTMSDLPLAALKSRGVRIVIDVELTGPQHFPVIDKGNLRYLGKFPMVTSTSIIAEYIKANMPDANVTLKPHIERIYFKESAIDQDLGFTGEPSQKRILIIHQYNPAGEAFLDRILVELNQAQFRDLSLTVALHPHTGYDRVCALKTKWPLIHFFRSGEKYKTNTFFSHVDGAISNDSTLADVVEDIGFPVYRAQDLGGLEGFVSHLNPKARNERAALLRRAGDDSFEAWREFISP